jgi:hypothetical protein
MISLALSLALAPSGCCNSLYLNSFELEAESGTHNELSLAEPSCSKPQLERKLQKIRC